MCALDLRSSPSQDRPGAEGTFGNTVKREERARVIFIKNLKIISFFFAILFQFIVTIYVF